MKTFHIERADGAVCKMKAKDLAAALKRGGVGARHITDSDRAVHRHAQIGNGGSTTGGKFSRPTP